MIEFMKSHYYDPYIAQFIRPKKEFKVQLNDSDKDFAFDEAKADLNKFDKQNRNKIENKIGTTKWRDKMVDDYFC